MLHQLGVGHLTEPLPHHPMTPLQVFVIYVKENSGHHKVNSLVHSIQWLGFFNIILMKINKCAD